MKIKNSISFVIEVLVEGLSENDFKETIVLRAPNGQPLAFIDEYSEIEDIVSSYLYPKDKEVQ